MSNLFEIVAIFGVSGFLVIGALAINRMDILADRLDRLATILSRTDDSLKPAKITISSGKDALPPSFEMAVKSEK